MRSFCGQRRVCSAPRGSPQTARQRNTAEVFASDLRVFGGELRRANRSCSGSAVVSARLRGWSWQSAALRATSFHQQNMRQAKFRVNIIFLRKTRARELSISKKERSFQRKSARRARARKVESFKRLVLIEALSAMTSATSRVSGGCVSWSLAFWAFTKRVRR